jgi:catalase
MTPTNKTAGSRRPKPVNGSTDKQEQMAASVAENAPRLTTNQGVQVPDNHNSLRAGVRGPSLLEDFIRRGGPRLF